MPNLQEGECRRLRSAIGARINQLTANKQAQSQLFRAIYSAIKERYNVESYSKLPSSKLQDALRFVAQWRG
ncbi:ORF6C domain-containing protein [Lysinibacillus sp. UGB7]|uniref:ORF6C domain-containing protein n=1 Tax=Lysinibacillus sp. UGB7 TaxID=3411039 RepID=UPI003B7C2190